MVKANMTKELEVDLCAHCLLPKTEHADYGKCLYLPTSYSPLDAAAVQQKDLPQIKQALAQAEAGIQRQIEALEQVRVGLERTYQVLICHRCNHRNPDGTSAWHSSFMYGECSICGEIDL